MASFQQVGGGSVTVDRLDAGARPPKPDRALKRGPGPSWASPVRKRLKRVLLRAIDRGWFGRVPLEAHLVICGFPRSGTTLLQLMLETAYPSARTFGVERSGLAAARNDWPGTSRLLVTKQPDDVFWVDEIREYYASLGTRTRVRFVFNVRDPRAVLTSVHGMNRDIYWVTPDRWRAIYDHYRYLQRFDDIAFIEYRDLVTDPLKVEMQLSEAIGMQPERSFADFHTAVPGTFDVVALNGVRPLDQAALDKWRAPKHCKRLRQILQEMPELPELLVEMGYEPDDTWTRDYL